MKKITKSAFAVAMVALMLCASMLTGFAAAETEDVMEDAMEVEAAAVAFSGITINAKNTGVELVRSSGTDVTFEYLGSTNSANYTITNPIRNGVMEIQITNNDPNFSYIEFEPSYKNVVRVNIPNTTYTKFALTLNQAPVVMQDFNAPVVINGSRCDVSVVDTTISRGTYNITNSSGDTIVTADSITKNITINHSSGEVLLTFNKKPTNLYLDTSGCTGYLKLPSGWSKTHTIGNGTPTITIKNSAYTEVTSK